MPHHLAARNDPSFNRPVLTKSLFTRDLVGASNATQNNSVVQIDGISFFNGTSYWAVTCVYSVSGVYTRFQRILFYVVLLVTFFLRFDQWLTAAGVAYIVTYSSTAAIHAMALSLQHNVGSDLDQQIMAAILAPGMFGGIVFALYSPRFLDTNPTNLFYLWTILISFALLLIGLNTSRFLAGFGRSAAMVACDLYNNCNDTCEAGVNGALFRSSYDQMVPAYLGPWMPSSLASKPDISISHLPTEFIDVGSSYMKPAISTYARKLIGGLFLGALLATQLKTLHYPPPVARNWIFRQFTSKRTAALCGWSSQRLLAARSAVSRSRKMVAKTLALGWYIWAWAGYVVWPAFFVYRVALNELELDGFPESERLQAVGQWGPWVGVALAFLVACVNMLLPSTGLAVEKPVIYLDNLTELPDSGPQSRSKKWFFISWPLYLRVEAEWKELRTWWRDPFQVSWEMILDVDADQREGGEEYRLLSFVNRGDGKEDLDSEFLLKRTSRQKEEESTQPWENYLSNKKREMGSVGQEMAGNDVLWTCNNQYDSEVEGVEEETKETKEN